MKVALALSFVASAAAFSQVRIDGATCWLKEQKLGKLQIFSFNEGDVVGHKVSLLSFVVN